MMIWVTWPRLHSKRRTGTTRPVGPRQKKNYKRNKNKKLTCLFILSNYLLFGKINECFYWTKYDANNIKQTGEVEQKI